MQTSFARHGDSESFVIGIHAGWAVGIAFRRNQRAWIPVVTTHNYGSAGLITSMPELDASINFRTVSQDRDGKVFGSTACLGLPV